MLLTCLLVGGSVAAVLVLFFRRLKKIEEELWGERARAKDKRDDA